jgi:P-type conjugative transfer protein TrbJ
MTTMRALASPIAAALLLAGASFWVPAPAEAGLPVFDAANYAQNLIQAARALDQINNQVKSLQNQAAMLDNMARNLKSVGFPQLQAMNSAMRRIDTLMGEAQAIGFKVDGLDRQVSALFPGEAGSELDANRQVAAARARLEAAFAAYRQSMSVQAGVAQNVREDAALLSELSATSQRAAGALEVGQAANQLLALSIKQQLQLQSLMASQFRESAIDSERRAQAEADGRAETRRFLGDAATAPAAH